MNKTYFIINWIKCIAYILFFIIIGALFSNNHFVIGSLLLGAGFVLFLFILENNFQERIMEEIIWITHCLMDEKELNSVKRQREFYSFILQNLKQEKIKNGMSAEEIFNFIKKHDKEETFSMQSYLYFNRENKSPNDKIELYGFGLDIPTPKLILKLKNKKLTNWEKIV